MELWFTEKHTENSGITAKVKKTLFTKTTPYQELSIIETYDFGRMMLLDGLVMLSEKDEFVYHEMLSHPSLFTHPNPQNVLIIGGGDGGTLSEVVKHPTVQKAVLVEIDEDVILSSKTFFPKVAAGFDSPKAKVIVGDGIQFVRETNEKFDVILIDSTDPIGPAEGLFSPSFYSDCNRILNQNGILTTQAETPFIDSFATIIPRVVKDFRSIFPIVKPYLASIPTYPSGLWAFIMGTKQNEPLIDFRKSSYENSDFSLKYYNESIHQAAFALPNFVKELCLMNS